jgi:hypothetical protein
VRNYVKEKDKLAMNAKWKKWKKKTILEKEKVALVMVMVLFPRIIVKLG